MKADTSDMIIRSQASLEQVQTGQRQVVDTDRLFKDIVGSIRNIQVQSNTVLKYSGEVVGGLQQINGQIRETNTFFSDTVASTSDVAVLVGEKSDASKEMVEELRRLNEEIHRLTVNVLENLEEERREIQ